MLNNVKHRKEQGFTIIEVLIVLAIAGLIMLVVFLAVPALQRNSRNTQRKSDAGAALSGFSEYTNNNGGAIPKDIDNVTNVNAPQWKKDSSVSNGTGVGTEFKTSFYQGADVVAMTARTSYSAPAIDTSKVTIINYAKCAKTSEGPTTASTSYATGTLLEGSGASTRSVVAVYATESSGGKVYVQCTES